mgnify:CR=1 FL=1
MARVAKTSTRPDAPTLVAALSGQPIWPPPVWLMRQAGRYLPEYRAVREQAGGFLSLCYTPDLAAEVTLQPIRRFGLDAAIIFSDILVVPHALGQSVWFEEGEGPRLEPVTDRAAIDNLSTTTADATYRKVFEALRLVRRDLDPSRALIGFCGGPWTVATYAVAGRGSADQAAARAWAYEDPEAFGRLIDLLTETSIDYLSGQIEAGADVIQIFESWAGALAEDQFARWVVSPTVRIVGELRRRHPQVPIIGFPRLAGMNAVLYVLETGVDGIGCDTTVPLSAMSGALAETGATVQGNLDPLLLVAGGDALAARVAATLEAMQGKPFIFNLGHGIVPQTPPEHVAELVAHIRRITIENG